AIGGVELGDALHRAAGFEILDGNAVTVGPLRLLGVDDPRVARDGPPDGDILASLGRDERFTLLLRHRPGGAAQLPPVFDLQLSGHTHGGQILPFGLVAWLANDHYLAGLYPLPDGRQLWVSRGAGTWGPPLRLMSPPEVVLLLLTPLPSPGVTP
ncbi:MAG: hypothetical protein H7831_14445, partial [Magnetococcus sp. WYHC-3]